MLGKWGKALDLVGSDAIAVDASVNWNDSTIQRKRYRVTTANIGLVDMQTLQYLSIPVNVEDIYKAWSQGGLGEYSNCHGIVVAIELLAMQQAAALYSGKLIYSDSQDAIAILKIANPSLEIAWKSRLELRFAHEIAKHQPPGQGQIILTHPAPTRGWLEFRRTGELQNAV